MPMAGRITATAMDHPHLAHLAHLVHLVHPDLLEDHQTATMETATTEMPLTIQ